MGKSKTISGALHRIPNLEHNNRDHWPPNATHDREDRNVYFVNCTRDFTIEQAYDKLFEASYQEWRQKEIKKSRGDRCPDTYYEKIQQDKQKHEQYEIIWQIGDMEDTGYENNFYDSIFAERALLDFAEHMLREVSNVTFLTKERIADPNWGPSFDEGIVINKMAFNGDESTPHLHMTFIPYVKNCSRGQTVQNAFSQTFKRMGYATTMKQAVDESDNLVWQNTPQGKVPQMKKVEYGAVTWIEEQKEWIADYMQKELGWERFFKGKNERGDLLLSDYRRERAAERAKEAEKKVVLVETDLKVKEKAVTEKASTIFKLDEMLTDKKKNLEAADEMVRYYDQKLDSAKKELAVVEDDYKAVANKLEEKSRKAEITEEVYFVYSGAGSDREHDLFEEVVQLRYENEKKDGEILSLKQKLNEAYEFMKRFMIGEVTLFEKFMQGMKEKVRDFVGIR